MVTVLKVALNGLKKIRKIFGSFSNLILTYALVSKTNVKHLNGILQVCFELHRKRLYLLHIHTHSHTHTLTDKKTL